LALAEERIDASREGCHAPRARGFASGVRRDFHRSCGVIGKLDYVLLPAMAIFFAVLIYGIAKRHRA
jgi:hypothetical protein